MLRRSFIGGLLAPAIVPSFALMPLSSRHVRRLAPTDFVPTDVIHTATFEWATITLVFADGSQETFNYTDQRMIELSQHFQRQLDATTSAEWQRIRQTLASDGVERLLVQTRSISTPMS